MHLVRREDNRWLRARFPVYKAEFRPVPAKSFLKGAGQVLIDGQGTQLLLVAVLLRRNDQSQFGFGIEVEALHGKDTRCPDVTFGNCIFPPPEASGSIGKSGSSSIEVTFVELCLARKEPGVVQERIEFAVGEPELVFGSVLSPALGLVGYAASLYGNLAFLNGTIELRVGGGLLGIGQLIDGVQLDALAKFLVMLFLHGCKAFLIGLVAVVVDVVFRRHCLHATVQLGVALACTETCDKQHRDARRANQV